MENYRAVVLKDYTNYSNIAKILMLNYKHTVEEFQEEINRVKTLKLDEIAEFGDDWIIIATNIDEKFDWYELELSNLQLYF